MDELEGLSGSPVRSLYDEERAPARVGTCTVYKRGGKEVCRRWYSTHEADKIKDAMLLLLETEWGFAVRVVGPAFNEPGCLEHDSVLEIYRTGYGVGGLGPPDKWTVAYEGTTLAEFDNPEAAVDLFVRVREEKELGHDMADLTCSGVVKAPEVVILKEPEPVPVFEPNQFVFVNGAVGVVVSAGVVSPGWNTVWFGGTEIQRVPAGRLKQASTPPVVCRYASVEELLRRAKEEP